MQRNHHTTKSVVHPPVYEDKNNPVNRPKKSDRPKFTVPEITTASTTVLTVGLFALRIRVVELPPAFQFGKR